ncbi:hypothetical protein J6590_005571 [Homalodisca vitripennis]|nr:hypothetical protein J6590_005571 [Homalodisca vitripennis]
MTVISSASVTGESLSANLAYYPPPAICNSLPQPPDVWPPLVTTADVNQSVSQSAGRAKRAIKVTETETATLGVTEGVLDTTRREQTFAPILKQ